jgi:site-specific DNA-methyltransferase (adenine-specific)
MQLLLGECVERMGDLADCSVDAVVTDPPYGISFMGKHWDRFDIERRVGKRDVSKLGVRLTGSADTANRKVSARTASAFANPAGEAGGYDFSLTGNRRFQEWCEQWGAETLRVLKPGGYMVVFGGRRTYHRLVAGLEDAGFEIRDQLVWLFGQGFPKNRDLGGGRGTALKPGMEPIVLVRKPFTGSLAATVAEHGTGGLNLEACAIPITDVETYAKNCSGDRGHEGTRELDERGATDMRMGGGSARDARWPANVLLDDAAAAMLDEQTGTLVSGANPTRRAGDKSREVYGAFAGQDEVEPRRGADSGGASRFFYCAKVSQEERNAGLGEPSLFAQDVPERNDHPTVKPLALMRWLVRLVTPPHALVLDPFMGSGTTGCAAVLEGREFVGVEEDERSMRIAEARITYWSARPLEAAA